MVPLLVSADEWARLERGLASADAAAQPDPGRSATARSACCGAACCRRRSCSRNPAFLRPCHGDPGPARHVICTCTRVDLARSPDGQWWVLADRTQAPSGAGYALENRHRAARAACPKRSASCHVQRLASFFRAQRDTLMALAPHPREPPKVVLLTPGSVQRDLLRARLPGALPRLHAGRRRRPHGARSTRLHQDARGPAAGRRHLPPARRRLLRSARAARRFVARRGRPGRGGARRQRRRRQRARLRRDRDGGDPAVPARRCAAQLLGEELLLPSVPTWWCGQPDATATTCSSISTQLVDQAGVPDEGTGAGLRPAAQRPREQRRSARDSRAARTTSSRRSRSTLSTRAGVAPAQPRTAPDRVQDLRRRRRRLVRGDAGRADARRQHAATCRSSRCSAAAAARTPGCSRTVR